MGAESLWTSKWNLYDHLGYLLVGVIGLLLIAFDLWLLGGWTAFPPLSLSSAPIWTTVAYFAGHVIQAISNICIKEKKEEFSNTESAILSDAREFFGAEEATDAESFGYCYMLACGRDITGHVTAFNAYYSLYRGWFVCFAAESVFLIYLAIVSWLCWPLMALAAGSIALTGLMHYRRRRFWSYLRAKTLQTFVVLKKVSS